MDLLIFLNRKSSRSEYIFDYVFSHCFGLEIEMTNDLSFFKRTNIPKISYCNTPIRDSLFFYSKKLLFEEDIKQQDLQFSIYKKIKIFFLCSDSRSALPFDPFASIFFMLTRYEEYLDPVRDQFGRFPAKESFAYKNNFLTIPVVDYWIGFIKEVLKNKFPDLKFKKNKFSYLNTIDVDNVFAYKGKSFVRLIAMGVKNILQCNWNKNWELIKFIFFQKDDPYNTYDKVLKLHHQYNLKTIFFFLLGDYHKYDRNISFKNLEYQELIKKIFNDCEIGIHNSFKSISNPSLLKIECERLASIIGLGVTSSRQHYICLNIPYNYQNLIKNKILNDYTMGFADYPGFRAGTSNPFLFFDLKINKSTKLLLYPFSIMDVTLKNYMNLNPQKSLIMIKSIIKEIKNVNGLFMSIWHNESLNYSHEWIGWDSVYEEMIKYIVDEKN